MAPLSIGIDLRLAGLGTNTGGGAPAVQPLRAISPTNRMNTKTNTFTAGLTNLAIKHPIWIGSGDVSVLVFSLSNFALGGMDIVLPNAAVTYGPFYAVEDSTGVSVPVTFGGQTTVTAAIGDTDIQSDPIVPSAFSKTKFSQGDKYYANGLAVVASGSSRVQCAPTFTQGGGGVGAYAIAYDPTATTITNLAAKGGFTFTGTTPVNTQPFSVIALGRFVTSDPATFIGIGDSIVEYVGDTTTSIWKGFFSRSLWSTLGSGAGCRGGINMGLAGGVIQLWLSANYAKLKPYLRYGNIFISEYGTNSFTTGSTGNVTTQLTNERSLMTAVHADAPVVGGRAIQIWRTKLLPRTSGANVLADGTDQTVYTTAWEAGGDVDLYNAGLAADVGVAGRLDAFISFDAQTRIDPSSSANLNYHRWIANSVDPASSPNLHPNSTTAEAMAAVLRPLMAAA